MAAVTLPARLSKRLAIGLARLKSLLLLQA